MVAFRALHLLQEALSHRAPVRQLRQLVRERVFLLRLEKLCVPDGDRGLGGDSVQKICLVLRELAPCVEVELHRPHQLAGTLHGNDQHVLRVTAPFDSGSGALVELHH